jgi:transcriptional regulator of heat shock response
MNNTFWINNPTILFKSEYIKEIYPMSGMTTEQKLNAMTRLIILLTILGYLVTQRIKLIITGVVTLGVIIILYYTNRNKQIKDNLKKKNVETFQNIEQEKINSYNINKNLNTLPSNLNPVMNVLLPEIQDNPKRLEAAPSFSPNVETSINENTKIFIENQFDDKNEIKDKLFKDLGDSFGFEQSMRNFYTTPNTQIPNDQGSFAEFCYGDMISCKEGNPIACVRNNPRYNNY